MDYDQATTITELKPSTEGQPVSQDSGPRYYSRFSRPQRYLHGFLAVTFLGLAMTGLTRRFSSAAWPPTWRAWWEASAQCSFFTCSVPSF